MPLKSSPKLPLVSGRAVRRRAFAVFAARNLRSSRAVRPPKRFAHVRR
jgi:hypothetical protein